MAAISSQTSSSQTPVIGQPAGVSITGIAASPDLQAGIVGITPKSRGGVHGFISGFANFMDQASGSSLSVILGAGSFLGLAHDTVNTGLRAYVLGRSAPPIAPQGTISAFIRSGESGSTSEVKITVIGADQIYRSGGGNSPSLAAFYVGHAANGRRPLPASIFGCLKGTDSVSSTILGMNSESTNLSALVWALSQGEGSLLGWIRPILKGSNDSGAAYTPIPPVDISGVIEALQYYSLPALIEPVPPAGVAAFYKAAPKWDLLGTVTGKAINALSASVQGVSQGGLTAWLRGTAAGVSSQAASYLGIGGSGERDLQAGISGSVYAGRLSLAAGIYGKYGMDLGGIIMPRQEGAAAVSAALIPIVMPDSLYGSLKVRGRHGSVPAFIRGGRRGQESLAAYFEADHRTSLAARYDFGKSGGLRAEILAEELKQAAQLGSVITGQERASLAAAYSEQPIKDLHSKIEPIEGETLKAAIKPKVLYINTKIPLTTFRMNSLYAMINAADCGPISSHGDLHVSIYGSAGSDLKGEIYGIRGRLAQTSDTEILTIKAKTVSEDWTFLVIDSPCVTSKVIPLSLVASPFSDLSASIVGIQRAADLSARIEPVYIPISGYESTKIGEWVNTKTGERKTIKFYFDGLPPSYFVSTEANSTFAEDSEFELKMAVETYRLDDGVSEDNLLAVRREVWTSTVENLESFSTLDEAIKHAIVRALHELSGTLKATVTAQGARSDLGAVVTAGSGPKSSLRACCQILANLPIIGAGIKGGGGFAGERAIVRGGESGVTSTPFLGEDGKYYTSVLAVGYDGKLHVQLVPVENGTPVWTHPSLSATVLGLGSADMTASISGTK